MGAVLYYDSSAGQVYGGVVQADISASAIDLFVAGSVFAGPTSPFTWANGDILRFTITYLTV